MKHPAAPMAKWKRAGRRRRLIPRRRSGASIALRTRKAPPVLAVEVPGHLRPREGDDRSTTSSLRFGSDEHRPPKLPQRRARSTLFAVPQRLFARPRQSRTPASAACSGRKHLGLPPESSASRCSPIRSARARFLRSRTGTTAAAGQRLYPQNAGGGRAPRSSSRTTTRASRPRAAVCFMAILNATPGRARRGSIEKTIWKRPSIDPTANPDPHPNHGAGVPRGHDESDHALRSPRR